MRDLAASVCLGAALAFAGACSGGGSGTAAARPDPVGGAADAVRPLFDDGAYLMPCTPMGFTFGAGLTFARRSVADLAAAERGLPPVPRVEIEGPSRPPLEVYWRRDRAGAALEVEPLWPLSPESTYTLRVDLAGFAGPDGPLGGERSYTFHTLANDAPGTWLVESWYSELQKRARDYEIYLPPGYGLSPTQRYPTLHGYVGGLSLIDNWRTRGDLDAKIDGMHQRCEVDPMIFAVPNPHLLGPVVVAGITWFVSGDYNDWWNGSQRFETHLTGEFVEMLERNWQVRADKWGRGTIGYSLSGYGAAMLAMRNPDVFGSFTAMSAFLSLRYTGENPYVPPDVAPYWTDPLVAPHSRNTFVEFVVRDLIKSLGPDVENWRAHNPVEIAESMTDEAFDGNILVATGLADAYEIEPMLQDFKRVLDARGVRHLALVTEDGNHTWPFWRRVLTDALPFHSRAFAGRPQPEALPDRPMEYNDEFPPPPPDP